MGTSKKVREARRRRQIAARKRQQAALRQQRQQPRPSGAPLPDNITCWPGTQLYQWIMDFPQRHLPRLRALAAKYQGEKEIVTFRAREEAERYLEALAAL